MTETIIQNILYWFANSKQHKSIIPNIFLYAWESDFISVTRSGYVHEYEIKISLSDYRHDFKKEERHHAIKNGERPLNDCWDRCRTELNLNGKVTMSRPNYFWYVCPENIIVSVPEYAGLIYIKNGNTNIIKVAPKLHRETITERQLNRINGSFSFKYWNLRNRESVAL